MIEVKRHAHHVAAIFFKRRSGNKLESHFAAKQWPEMSDIDLPLARRPVGRDERSDIMFYTIFVNHVQMPGLVPFVPVRPGIVNLQRQDHPPIGPFEWRQGDLLFVRSWPNRWSGHG